MKIVVIDDEASMRNLIRERLRLDGHEIVLADNGVTGLQSIRQTIPDLIISDIKMPEMNGDELFTTLRSTESDLSVIPFIFLSGEANEREQIKRLNNGADACFEKPVNIQLLAAHVNSSLARVNRVSNYIKRQLDNIAEALPRTIETNFSSYQSLLENTNFYASSIVSALHEQFSLNKIEPCNTPLSETSRTDSQINYLKFCLLHFNDRREIVKTINGEDLSWTIIFTVALAHLQNQKVYVSDLYVSIPSAKSTIHTRIDSLILDNILTKNTDTTDGRRQQISLTDSFTTTLLDHINKSLNMLKQLNDKNLVS